MDRNIILKQFISRGIQINKQALDMLYDNPNLLDSVLKIDNNNLPTTITLNFLETLEEKPKEKTTVVREAKTVMDRYIFLRDVLSVKPELTNLMSISKINERTKDFSVIGIVVENNGKLVLEDTTGYYTFSISNDLGSHILKDEVIGAVCQFNNSVIEIKNVVYPDIPLRKEATNTKADIECIFISDIHMDSPSLNRDIYINFIDWVKSKKNLMIFLGGGISERQSDIDKLKEDIGNTNLYFAENTTKQIEEVKIFSGYIPFIHQYSSKLGTTLETTIMNLLKKRNLDPTFGNKVYSNSFLLKDIPDILVLGGTGTPSLFNYKGTTVVTNGSFLAKPEYWQLNLKTRETFKINFS